MLKITIPEGATADVAALAERAADLRAACHSEWNVNHFWEAAQARKALTVALACHGYVIVTDDESAGAPRLVLWGPDADNAIKTGQKVQSGEWELNPRFLSGHEIAAAMAASRRAALAMISAG